MEQIARAIKERQLVVFAGAGISKDAGLPDWVELGCQLYERLLSRIPENSKDVAKQLLCNKENIPNGMDFLFNFVARLDVGNEIRDILKPKKESLVYEILKKLDLPGFVTTNYDRLLDTIVLDNSFRLTNSVEKLELVSNAVNNAVGNLGNQFLLKLHGDIDDLNSPDDIEIARGGPFMVLSKSDYSSLVQGERGEALRLALHAILQRVSILFLGYGFGDPDIKFVLDFLARHCKFPHQSYFIGVEGESLPQLPERVTGIQPFKNWEELPHWLNKLHETGKALKIVVDVEQKVSQELPDKKKRELKILAEFLYGLETEDLCEKTISVILINELLKYEEVTWDWLVKFISNFLEVGDEWANTFAKATIRHLVYLKLVKEQSDKTSLRIIKSRVNNLYQRTISEYNEQRQQFFESVKDRMDKAGMSISDDFIIQIDSALQHVCMCYGQRMAEWIQLGSGKEFGLAHIREIIPIYFSDPQDKRITEDLFEHIFDSPTDKESLYLYRLISSSFLLNSIKLDPSASKFLKESIAKYELYLDSNILLPLIVQEHNNNKWISAIISASQEAGATLFVLNDILNEVFGHREVAKKIHEEYRDDREYLTIYTKSLGFSANCFIQGYLLQSSKWKDYINRYNDSKIQSIINEIGIKIVGAENFDKTTYNDVLKTIREEWNKKEGDIISRNDKLNIDDAKQFCQIYNRRREMNNEGKGDNAWFLSYETLFEKVYQRNPSKWEKPPTFPLSAWASFLDSRILFEHKNPKAILTAILKGNSSSYKLPDTIELVKEKAFGNSVLSKDHYEALHAITDGKIFDQLEKARKSITSRTQKLSFAQEYKEVSQSIIAEIDLQLGEKIKTLEKQLADTEKNSSEEVSCLNQEIENLKIQLKRRKRHKERYQKLHKKK